MDHYNFWQDFFDTYQSLSDWLKFAWLVVPPAFLLGFVALAMRYRLAGKRAADTETGNLAYTVFADENGGLRIYTHDGAEALATARSDMAVLPLPLPKSRRHCQTTLLGRLRRF
ncbi:hypothetical protein GN330_14575 [Nitratireductor sp. CAU 1489]|uniref:Uncharacterized protein n=1 Tax=Nitratireductor arenosus TaxID=2682096 RepID=A0A844QKP6_9HYPH|nr:hypothetical protein [Nitratireductor arenosus]MVA98471.1 hypothetical protein [Nitratireductor arenosus]